MNKYPLSIALAASCMLALQAQADNGFLPPVSDFGILDTQHVDLPRNVDVEYLRTLENRSGTTFAEMLSEIDTRLSAFNRTTDPLMAALMAPPTDEVYVEDPVNGVIEWRRHTEKTPARPGVVEGPTGHNLAIEAWDNALGWTEDGLLEAPARQITNHVVAVLTGLRRRHRREFWRRLFGNHEQKVDAKSNATSPGFAGSGTGLNAFSATHYPDGSTTENNYSHYFRVATDASAARPAIKLAKRQMSKWLGEGTWEFLGTPDAVNALMQIPSDLTTGFLGFTASDAPLIIASPNDQRARVDPNVHVGVLDGDIRIRKPLEDFGGAYGLLYRSQGNFAEGNPLIWRYDALRGVGAFLRSRNDFPLAEAIMLQWFGINVNNRINGCLFKFGSSGNYTAPNLPN